MGEKPGAARAPDTTILVLSDEVATHLSVSDAIEGLATVIECAWSSDAMRMLETVRPDLVVLDFFPETYEDALEFCRRLRRHRRMRHVPVLAAASDPGTIDAAYDAGATDSILKPLDSTTLFLRLRFALRHAETMHALRLRNDCFAAAQSLAGLGNWEYARASDEFVLSGEAARIFGLSPRDAVPPGNAVSPGDVVLSGDTVRLEQLLESVHPDDRPGYEEAMRAAVDSGRSHALQFRIQTDDGALAHAMQWTTAQFDPYGGAPRLIGSVQDVSERREAEAEIRSLAYRDDLTGLPNRRLFADRLAQAIGHAERAGRKVAVMHLDLDGFKTINDGFGHDTGDQLLQRVAERLAGCLRSSDTVARGADSHDPTLSCMGGDEFVLVLPEVKENLEPAEVASRIQQTLGQPFRMEGAELLVTSSIGISIYPNDGTDAETLIRGAERALAHAKAAGGNSFIFFDDGMNTDAASRLEIAGRLHRGLELEQFDLVYQPIFDGDSLAVCGLEALVRWNHPERGVLLPGEFVPIAEESGLILPLGSFVLERACSQWWEWFDAGLGPVALSINVAARQFADPGFVHQVDEVVRSHGVDPRFLRFDITEGVLMKGSQATLQATHDIKQLGIGISVDDFGTGYSSLNYLRQFPADVLKIDRSFIAGLPTDQECSSLVSAIVAMAHKLRLRVVAEGVETEEQLRFLKALDCEELQGFLLGRPAAAEELEGLLRDRLQDGDGAVVVPFRRAVS